MQSNKQNDTPAQPEQGPLVKASVSRRSLLRAGLGATPVALTFVSQPVLATNCRAISSFASLKANSLTSRAPVLQGSCTGFSPAKWKTNTNLITAKVGGATFASCFGTAYSFTATNGTVYNTPTLLDVIKFCPGTSTRDQLALNVVAAYLNHEINGTPNVVVTLAQLTDMWTNVGRSTPVNYPVTGVTGGWTLDQVNQFLTQTFVG